MKVTVFQDSKKRVMGFQISGHAGFAEAGQDIVCAAVSTLAFTTVNGIEKFAGQKPEIQALNEAEGFMEIHYEDPSKESTLLLNTFVLGIKDIQKEYKEYIDLIVQEV